MMRPTKRWTPALFAVVLIGALAMLTVGCGQGEGDASHSEADVQHDEAVDPHEGHSCDGEHDEEVIDPHAGHDHGDESTDAGLTLSGRDLADAGIALAVAGPGEIASTRGFWGRCASTRSALRTSCRRWPGRSRGQGAASAMMCGPGRLWRSSRVASWPRLAPPYLGARGGGNSRRSITTARRSCGSRHILAEQDYLDAKLALLEADIELQAAEQTLHALGTSDAELELLEESHEAGAMTRLELRAPISGTVTDLHMVLGETVGEDSDVLAVADLSTVWVDLDVPQTELGAVRKGQKVMVSVSGLDGRTRRDGCRELRLAARRRETRTVLREDRAPERLRRVASRAVRHRVSVAPDHLEVAVSDSEGRRPVARGGAGRVRARRRHVRAGRSWSWALERDAR